MVDKTQYDVVSGKELLSKSSCAMMAEAGIGGERHGASGEDRKSVEESGERRATCGSPQEDATTAKESKNSRALQWLADDEPRRPLSLLKPAMQNAHQFRHSLCQASAKSPAPLTSIEATRSTDVLHQLLQKPETALAVQLRAGKNGFNAFLYQACVPSIWSAVCSYGLGHQTAKHIIIYCRNFLATRQALRDRQGYLPGYKQLVTTPTDLKKITRLVIERGMLGQYQRARGLLNPHLPTSPSNN